ncbi:MAG: pilus assembly protein PilP [Nitrospirae bacterium]|nr:pilus assembly protein PilP [Nitrospirota bacterium]
MGVIVILILLLTLNGCSEQAGKPPVQQPKQRSGNVSNQPLPAQPENPLLSPAGTDTKEAYSYHNRGRRDPFKSLLYGIKEKKKAGLTPLQQRSLSELRVIGIVWGQQGYIAMIETPDGKGFVIKEGTLVGPDNGVVKKITGDSVIIEESYTDYYGKNVSKKTVLGLRSREESGG